MDPATIESFMREALLEGRKARPDCAPNPPVGCVIVADGRVVARGHTSKPGGPHAEAAALAQLEGALGEASVFVTLEPCSFRGRTPSCARALVDRGVTSIYVGLVDPHPRNRGAGIRNLKESGAHVVVGVLGEEAERDLGPYLIRD